MSTYVTDTLALLASHDPLVVLAETPAWIAVRVRGLSRATLHQPEGEGKWSLTQVLAHLTDAEIAYGWRARMILTQDRPPLVGFDQNIWLSRFDYATSDPAEALQGFTALRRWNMRVWSSATAADLQRIGVHAERGPESLDVVLRLAAGHDLRHRRQIERLLRIER